MKILIAGTHFTPAIALIEELKKEKGVEIIYAGRKTTLEGDKTSSIESVILPSLNVEFISIITGRLYRRISFYALISFLKIPVGFLQAFIVTLKNRPDIVVSFGGYISVPIVFVSWLFSIPVISHEQGITLGLANKINSIFSDKIALSFPGKNEDERYVLTGNPLRKSVLNAGRLKEYRDFFDNAKKKGLKTILVTGGNQGAHTINLAIEDSLKEFKKIAALIHITGDSKFKDYERLKEKEEDGYLVRKWINEDFGGILKEVDLVICRGGINTIMEVLFFGKPMIIIPLSKKINTEQIKNAKYFEKYGMVKILYQEELSGKNLLSLVNNILKNLEYFKQKALKAKAIINPDAAKALALQILLTYEKK